MGVFDFIKNAGDKIFGKGDDQVDRSKPLSTHLRENGIDPAGIAFTINGDTVVMEGTVRDQDTREKAVLIVGNVDGVDRVDDRLRVAGVDFGNVSSGSSTVAAPRSPAGAGTTVAHGSPGSNDGWSSKTYTVVAGDSLSAIAKKVYGDAGKYNQIYEANQPMLKDPDKIYPGQVLRIPADA